MGCGPRARADVERGCTVRRGSGSEGTKGTASLGQPRGKERKLAGSPIEGEGQLSRCRDVSPRLREKEEVKPAEGKESTTLPSSQVGAVGPASVDAGRGRA